MHSSITAHRVHGKCQVNTVRPWPLTLTLLLAVTLLACSPKSRDWCGTAYSCLDGVACPSGFQCQGQVCVASPDSVCAATGADAQATDGSGLPACGSPLALTEDFEATVQPRWLELTTEPGTDVQFLGGRLRFTLPEAPAQDSQAVVASMARFDLRNSRIYFELPQMVNTSSGAFVRAELQFADGENAVEWIQDGGANYFGVLSDGTATFSDNVPFDAGNQRWWQFREAGGTVFWEASADGQAWSPLASTTAPAFLDKVRFVIVAGAFMGATNPGSLHVDNINGGGVPPVPWCGISSLMEDFSVAPSAVDWQPLATNCTTDNQSGRLRLLLDSNAVGLCGYQPTRMWSLRDDSLTVEVPSMVDTSTAASAQLLVSAPDGDIAMRQQQNTLTFEYCDPICRDVDTTPYDPTAHRWWRITENGGMILWQTSADTTSWQTQTSTATTITVRQVSVSLSAATQSAIANPGEVAFDNYNTGFSP